MNARERPGRGYNVALGIVTFLGLYHGAVPLVVRLAFDRDQRFAPALWLPSPWWWIACLAVILSAFVVWTAIQDAKQRRYPHETEDSTSPADSQPEQSGSGAYDSASAVVFLVGIYNGVAPFIARLIFDGNLLLALPLRLRAPWWWITSLAVIVITLLLLTLIDAAKQRRHPE